MGSFYNSYSDDDDAPSPREIFAAAWDMFSAMFPTNESRIEALYERISAAGNVACNKCGCMELQRKYGSRVARCSACKAQVHFTSGTFFHGKRALGAIFAVIWLKELGVFFSKTQIHEHAKVASSTAWQIVTEIDMLISERLESDASAISFESSLFQPLVCKRSFATPAFKHPRAEQFELEKDLYGPPSPGPAAAPVSPPSKSTAVIAGLSGEEKLVFDLISAGPLNFEALLEATAIPYGRLSAVLLQLELQDLIERQPGDVYAVVEPKSAQPQSRRARPTGPRHMAPPGPLPSSANPAPAANQSIDNLDAELESLFTSVGRTLHGISRKYLQLHLASYWCSVDRDRWPSGSLFDLVLHASALNRASIRAFVTPLSVKMIFA